jgi:hypothetical protein
VGNYNVALGDGTLTSNNGSQNVAVGAFAGSNLTTGSFNIDINNSGVAGDVQTTRIGDSSQFAAFIGGIRGRTTGTANAIPVLIDSNGQLGTTSSSRRYKEDIDDMAEASAGLMRLHPVTFRYKKAYVDGLKPVDYGLIAEEVAEVYPDLVARDSEGRVETVQYQKLTPMLLNELQKQHEVIQEQEQYIRRHETAEREQAERIRLLEARMVAIEALLSSKPHE